MKLGSYVGARLHRRMFVAFGVAIVGSMFCVVGVKRLVDGNWHPAGQRDVTRLQTYMSAEYESMWDNPAQRDAYARRAAQALDMHVSIKDAAGKVLMSEGECAFYQMDFPVARGDTQLGTVTVCADPKRYPDGWRHLAWVIPPGLLLWFLSGLMARRVARPLEEVARVAQEIGAGNLKARAALPCSYQSHGEEVMLSNAINDMATKIEKQMVDQRELLAAVSHELRTPLARIRVLTELSRGAPGDGQQLDGIDREVEEMDRLVGDLLASARLDFQAISPRTVDAAVLGREALERSGVPVGRLQVDPGNTQLQADPTLVSRALQNLVMNAQSHGRGLEALRITPDADGIRAEALDGGPGFTAPELQKAFEAFNHKGKNGGGSLGLGLALVKRIAAAHGGDAFVGNREEGVGARVGFSIPRMARVVRAIPSAADAAT